MTARVACAPYGGDGTRVPGLGDRDVQFPGPPIEPERHGHVLFRNVYRNLSHDVIRDLLIAQPDPADLELLRQGLDQLILGKKPVKQQMGSELSATGFPAKQSLPDLLLGSG